MKCSYSECSNKTFGRKKLCPTHQRQKRLYGVLKPAQLHRLGDSMQSRLDGRFAINPMNGCHEWIGATVEYGYGVLRYKGRNYLAHRFSYLANVGPIPDGMEVCHKCDNAKCLNPEHLFVGTHKDNMVDMAEKKRPHFMRATHCKNGHELSGDNVYNPPYSPRRRICRECDRIRSIAKNAKRRAKRAALKPATSNP